MALNIILWDGAVWQNLLPFSYTRPVALLRCGILTIAEKFEKYTPSTISHLTEPYLRVKYPVNIAAENLLVHASVLPDNAFIKACLGLSPGSALYSEGTFLAGHFGATEIEELAENGTMPHANKIEYTGQLSLLDEIWKIFTLNDQEIKKDFELVTAGRESQKLDGSVRTKNPERIFLEEGASVYDCSLNASGGPIYIGKDAEVWEGSFIRGSFALCEHSGVKMGAKIYGGTTVGPHCRVGGEISNSVLLSYSNKGHDGFLGNAVIGEWCNIGADSNNSNLKNNYDEVKLWSFAESKFVKTGLQFCGLFMGDHSKCGINTMFNTGTVVGVSANIFGAGFPRNYIASYSWGGASGFTTYMIDKALDTATRMMDRRHISLSEADVSIMNHIFEVTKPHRNF